MTREQPLVEPSIWVGDPQSLAAIVSATPDLILSAGAVAAESAFIAWADTAADGMIWVTAYPEEMPSDFAESYQSLAGSFPKPIAALAYAATGQALEMIANHPERSALGNALRDVPAPQIQVFQRYGDDCCLLLSP